MAGRLDTEFGIRSLKDGYFIGSRKVDVIDGELVYGDGAGPRYELTPGLWELVTKRQPVGYTDGDLENYAEIILDTNVYKARNCPESNKLKVAKTQKYKQIIVPILQKLNILKDTDERKKRFSTGKGLQKRVIPNNNKIEYVYWDNLDELLERLHVLYGELKSGNTNLAIGNEIISIVQEFKEM